MKEIIIDPEACKKDGLCAAACPRGILTQEEPGTIPGIVAAYLDKCLLCGHCVAICPHEAIKHSHFPAGTVNPVRTETIPAYDQVLELVRSRRSRRLFKDTPVERDTIEKVIEAARFAPSGHNEQTTEFVIVRDREVLGRISALTAEGLENTVKNTRNPIGRMMMRLAMGRRGAAYVTEMAPELEGLVSLFRGGTDLILRDAPALLLFCADSAQGSFARINANLALHNAALAAEALGLGCFYVGFVVIVSERDDRIARLVSLPETHKIYGGLAVGYPRLKYSKWPERNPARTTWV